MSTDQSAIFRRSQIVIAIAQMLAGIGLSAGISVGALLAEDRFKSAAAGGLPTALFTVGAAVSVWVMGRVTARWGRRAALSGGLTTGALGSLIVVAGVWSSQAMVLLLGLLMYGAGSATNLQSRFAATDLALPHQRGQAISVALLATTVGAVGGPNTIAPASAWAGAHGLPPLAGPFVFSGAAFAAAALVLFIWLRPDPYLVAKSIAATTNAGQPARKDRRLLMLGAAAIILPHAVMVAVMTMTPVYMRHHGHGLSAVGVTISAHVAAMYLPSLVTGRLADRWGRLPLVVASAVTSVLACVTAGLGAPTSMPTMMAALILLGLGWNFGMIAGTSIVTDATSALPGPVDGTALPSTTATGPHVGSQSNVDIAVALSGAGAGLTAGFVVGQASFELLAALGAAVALLVLVVAANVRSSYQGRR